MFEVDGSLLRLNGKALAVLIANGNLYDRIALDDVNNELRREDFVDVDDTRKAIEKIATAVNQQFTESLQTIITNLWLPTVYHEPLKTAVRRALETAVAEALDGLDIEASKPNANEQP